MNYSEIHSAKSRLYIPGRPFLRETPLWRLPGSLLGVNCAEVWLKLEHLQVSGSFKARGMMNRLMSHSIPASGVIVASGGNAGIATAAAARALGVRCEVFVPTVSSEAKRAKLRELGAELVVTGAAYGDALQACLARQAQTGALMTHAYDQPEVVAGAGTLALEIAEQAQGLPDAVLVSVGGGGLVAGLALGFAGLSECKTQVIALEPENAPTLHSARQAGRPVDVTVSGVAADSLGAKRIGDIAWQVSQAHVHQSLLLSDSAISAAQKWMWKELRLAVEPAAALPLAALQTGVYTPAQDGRVCLVVCGGNVDPGTLA
jgi:threonine dehydratase